MSNYSKFSERPLDVVGIGNAIVDVVVQVDDDFLNANELNKGSMVLVSEEQAQNLYLKILVQ